jgi:hypothetical protein
MAGMLAEKQKEAADLAAEIARGPEVTEQSITDDWVAATGAITPLLSRSGQLFHTTRAENIAGIAHDGLVPGKPARFDGVSSAGRVSLAATEQGAAYYGGPGDVMLRTKAGFKPASMDRDLLGGDGSFTVGEPIPAAQLEAKIGGKWVGLDAAAKAIASGARLDDITTAGTFKKGDKVVTRDGRAGTVMSVDAGIGAVEVKLPNGMKMKFLGDHVRLAAGPSSAVFSRAAHDVGAGVKASALEAMAALGRKAMPGLPPVLVLNRPSEAPEALRKFIEARGAMGDAEGALHDGKIYLFAAHLSDMDRAEHVLLQHEAGHAGLAALLGSGKRQAMQAIYNQNAAVRRQAEALRTANPKMSVAEATEEVLVDMPRGAMPKLVGWRLLVERVRDALQARGLTRIAGWLDRQLQGSLSQQQRADLFVANLMHDARAALRSPAADRTVDRSGAGTMLQSGKLADDIAAQEKWLNAEARARGFKDIEDLLAKNYPLFEKLAELWRKKNPAEALLSTSGATDPYARAVQAWKAALARAPRSNAPAGQSVSMPLPVVFMAMNVKARTLELPLRYLEGIVGKHNELPASVLSDLPELLSNPLVVFPYKDGGLRAVLDAKSAKGDPVVAGIGMDGRIQTVFAVTELDGLTGAEQVAAQLNTAMAKDGAKVYGRNKEALAETRASRGVPIGLLHPNQSSSTGAGPDSHSLHRAPRDKANVVLREKAVKKHGEFGPGIRLSRATGATPQPTAQERAEAIIQQRVTRAAPLDRISRLMTRTLGVERLAAAVYDKAAFILDRYTPERIKAGVVSDYGVPEAVIDQRALLQGRQRVQLRKAGTLIEKLSTLTRAESRVAYAWMNEADPELAARLMDELPADSVQVLGEVSMLIEKLSKEAIAMGQLSPEAYQRNRFAYLRRSYLKHVLPTDEKGQQRRQRAIAILGEQYKGRGLTEAAPMRQIQNTAPEWWQRKVKPGQADASLKGQKFIRLERRALQEGAGVAPLMEAEGPANPNAKSPKKAGRLREIHYYPAGEPLPAKYADWDQAGTWEVRRTHRGDAQQSINGNRTATSDAEKRKAQHLAMLGLGRFLYGRGGGIRTRDPLHPMQVRYQAALRPDEALHYSAASAVSQAVAQTQQLDSQFLHAHRLTRRQLDGMQCRRHR